MNWSRFFKPSFLVIAALLLVTTVGMKFAIAQMNLILEKQRIDLRKPLFTIPTHVGPYKVIDRHDRMSAAEEASLGTPHYISYIVHDTRKQRPAPNKGLTGDAFALFRFHVAYYTGTPDTVPHVPERCFVGGGADAQASGSATLTVTRPDYIRTTDGIVAVTESREPVMLPEMREGKQVDMKLFTFRRHPQAPKGYVGYFFMANNQLMGSAEEVRKFFLLNYTDRYAYYVKIECNPLTTHEISREEAIKAMSELQSYFFPEVVACLPDWQAVTSGEAGDDRDRDRETEGDDPVAASQ